jgi:hypothetical protein
MPVKKSVSGDGLSDGLGHRINRPVIASFGLRKRHLPVDKPFSDCDDLTYLDCACVERTVVGWGGRASRKDSRDKKIRGLSELWWSVPTKTCPNAELRQLCAYRRTD